MEPGLRLLRHFLSEHPLEAAMALETAPVAEAAAILADQSPEVAVRVWQHMAIPAAAASLGAMELPSAIALLCRISAPRAALMIYRQSLPVARNFLHACPDPWRTALERACDAGPLSVGALMHPAPAALPVDWTVRKTGEFLTRHPEFLAFDIFVVDREWRLVGRTDLHRLATSAGGQVIGGRMQRQPSHLLLHSAVAAAREDILWRTNEVLPVTDEVGLLVGALWHKRLRSMEDKLSEQPVELRSLAIEIAELAWTGFAGALEAAAAVTHLTAEEVGS
jgi:Mg/Co/Ni transporter MgtE